MSRQVHIDPVRSNNAIAGAETWILEPPGLGVALRVSIVQPAKPVLGPALHGPLPIVYATDADYCFGTVVDAARVGGSAGDMSAAIVVGIGYAREDGSLEFTGRRRIYDFYRGSRRTLDMGAYGSYEMGGADAFLAALREHVIPTVEPQLTGVDATRRVLLGASAGGHFAAYALTQDPALFRGYALMSPVLVDYPPPPDDVVMVRLVENLPEGALSPEMRVFLSAGSREEDPAEPLASLAIISNAYRMRAALARHGVATELALFTGETHTSVLSTAIGRALRFLLPAPGPKPDWRAALTATKAAD